MKITHEIKDVRVISEITLSCMLAVGMRESLAKKFSAWSFAKLLSEAKNEKERKFVELTRNLYLRKPHEVEKVYEKTMALVTLERKMTSREVYSSLAQLDGFPACPASFSEGMNYFREARRAGIKIETVAHLGLQLLDQETFFRWLPVTSSFDKIWAEILFPQKIFDPYWQIIAVKKETAHAPKKTK